MNIEEIKQYVKKKHGNQTRIQGTPYYLHPSAVAEILKLMGYDLNYQIVGLFHDLLEDADTTYEELESISTREIANAVKLLTKENNYVMSDYIDRIRKNEIAKAVKLADRLHNLQEAHYASEKWRKKYIKETEDWYIELARNTKFENNIEELLKILKDL